MSNVTKDNMEEFIQLACRMDNSHCDGEVPASRVRQIQAGVRRDWKALEKKIGRKMSEEEVWEYAD